MKHLSGNAVEPTDAIKPKTEVEGEMKKKIVKKFKIPLDQDWNKTDEMKKTPPRYNMKNKNHDPHPTAKLLKDSIYSTNYNIIHHLKIWDLSLETYRSSEPKKSSLVN